MNEAIMQATLMRWAMDDKKHQLAIPNITTLYPWEADLISATNSWLVHEYEVKVSRSDFLADANKRHKHRLLETATYPPRLPNYFWYAINGFDVTPDEVPAYAGLLRVDPEKVWWERVTVVKSAPRLHTHKLAEKRRLDIARWLSYKLKNLYRIHYLNGADTTP